MDAKMVHWTFREATDREFTLIVQVINEIVTKLVLSQICHSFCERDPLLMHALTCSVANKIEIFANNFDLLSDMETRERKRTLGTSFKYRPEFVTDHFHKWRCICYSFVFMLIRPPGPTLV